MRILVFSHYYYPEGNAPASRMHAMCSRWASQGHDVQVITSAPNAPDSIVYDGYKNRLYQSEVINEVKVKRVWTYLSTKKGTLRMAANFVSYMIMAVIVARFSRRPDIIVATSPQFFCGWAGLLAARFRLRKVPFILEIRDLWPDTIVTIGALNNQRLLRMLYRLEKWMYAGATHIVTVGKGYREDLLSKGVPSENISLIPNGVDKSLFIPAEPDQEIIEKYGLGGKTVCAYVGTIGMCAGLNVVVEAGKRLKEIGRDDITLLMVGDGAERKTLEDRAREAGLDNLLFVGRVPKEEVPKILATSDICIVHLQKSDLFTRVLPSKIFEMAAMKKPIVLGVQGCAAELLEEAKAGIAIEPENAIELVDTLCRLADNAEESREFGENGRDYVLEHYDREQLADRYIEILSSRLK